MKNKWLGILVLIISWAIFMIFFVLNFDVITVNNSKTLRFIDKQYKLFITKMEGYMSSKKPFKRVVTYCERCKRKTKHMIVGENDSLLEITCTECKLDLGDKNVLQN